MRSWLLAREVIDKPVTADSAVVAWLMREAGSGVFTKQEAERPTEQEANEGDEGSRNRAAGWGCLLDGLFLLCYSKSQQLR